MNAREGMRRLAIATGCLGAVSGIVAGYLVYTDKVQMYELSQSSIRRAVTNCRDANSTVKLPPEFSVVCSVGSDGIDYVSVNESWQVKSIHFVTGGDLPNVKPPSALMAAGLCFALGSVGFLIPWALLHVFVWIGAGFFQTRQ